MSNNIIPEKLIHERYMLHLQVLCSTGSLHSLIVERLPFKAGTSDDTDDSFVSFHSSCDAVMYTMSCQYDAGDLVTMLAMF